LSKETPRSIKCLHFKIFQSQNTRYNQTFTNSGIPINKRYATRIRKRIISITLWQHSRFLISHDHMSSPSKTLHPHRHHLLHPWPVPTAHPSNPSPKIPNPLVLRQTHPLPFPLRHTNARRLSASTSYRTSC